MAFPEWEILTISRYTTSDICLQRPVYIKELQVRTAFLAIAARTADYLEHLYEEAERTGEVQTAVCPSHYMGLVEMYRTTGEERYLKLAKQAIALRDSVKNGYG